MKCDQAALKRAIEDALGCCWGTSSCTCEESVQRILEAVVRELEHEPARRRRSDPDEWDPIADPEGGD